MVGHCYIFQMYQFIKVYCQLQDRSVYNSINSGTEIRELGNVQLKVKVFVLSNYLYLCLENTVYEQQSLEVANLWRFQTSMWSSEQERSCDIILPEVKNELD